jgi:hypothetical protein
MRPATFVESRGMLWKWWRARSTVLVTVDLDSISDLKPANNLAGKLPTRSKGTGMARVGQVQPVPLPHCTLPVTRAGFETCDNH